MLLSPVERPNGSVRIQTKVVGETLTEQSHRAVTNINVIVAKARKGIPVHTNLEPYFGDFTSGTDFRESLDKVRDAQRDFLTYPPEIRKRFRNDPAEFLDFVTNPDNAKALEEMGLGPKNTPAIPQVQEETIEAPEEAQAPTE